MEFEQLCQRAMQIRARYAAFEREQHGESWSNEELALGFVGDVGDLEQAFLHTMDDLEGWIQSHTTAG